VFKFCYDRMFVSRFRAGDRAALGVVYVAYRCEVEAIVRKFLGMTPWRGAADADDAVHEIFLRAFGPGALKAVNGSQSFGAYLARIARNFMIDWLRQDRESIVLDPDVLDGLPAFEEVEEFHVGAEEAVAFVDAYLARLPVDLRQVYEYRLVSSKTQFDTCKALAISRQQLRTRERRLRIGLMRELRRAAIAVSNNVRRESN
jgi:RNA polymerase sigma factor (sigma-70 family)